MTAPPLGWRTVNEPVSNTTIPQDSTGVNNYDMQNGGGNSQFSFGRVNGKSIDVEYDGDVATGATGTRARGAEVAAPYDEGAVKTVKSQAIVDLSDDTELSRRLAGIYGAEKYKRIPYTRYYTKIKRYCPSI